MPAALTRWATRPNGSLLGPRQSMKEACFNPAGPAAKPEVLNAVVQPRDGLTRA